MIGLDTNVLVRYLTQDDASQSRRVDALFAELLETGDRIHIDDLVLCEAVWVLRAAYRLGKPTIVSALERILSTAAFSFDDREALRAALEEYENSSGDFADYVIGRRNRAAGCETTVTFDRSLAGCPAFTLL